MHEADIFFSTTVPGFFLKRVGGYETNINLQVYSFHVIFNTETMRIECRYLEPAKWRENIDSGYTQFWEGEKKNVPIITW